MKAKAEAARARADHARKELQILKECAQIEGDSRIREAHAHREKYLLEAELKALREEKVAAAAGAELRLYTSDDSDDSSEYRLSVDKIKRTPSLHPMARAKKYVQDQAKVNLANNNNNIVQTDTVHSNFAADVTKFLLKKDLLLSQLIKYNDTPETFAIWKASFTNIMKDLQVTPFEEMDLLVKYLGNESSKYAMSLCAANTSNPVKGLKRIWDRQDERYGSPEVIDACLRAKLDKFPKIASKDSKKLYDLTDLLCEIESVKENPRYVTLLSYFDASSGVTPVVNKLPHDKWITHSSRYKTEHSVSFPPFTVLVEFMRKISKVKNDPALQYEGYVESKLKTKVGNNRFQQVVQVKKNRNKG